MLDTLEARLAQAHAGDLGHLEFLQVLCGDEIARRDAAALERRLRAARFEATMTMEDLDFSYNPKIPAAHIRDLATLRFIDHGESVVLHGPVGVGKSHVAQALGHAACRRGHSVAFTKTSRLLADLAGGHADRSWEHRLRRWARVALLILDDFAMRQFTPTQADDLYELISERAGRSLVITANRAASDWYSLFPNPGGVFRPNSLRFAGTPVSGHRSSPGPASRPRPASATAGPLQVSGCRSSSGGQTGWRRCPRAPAGSGVGARDAGGSPT
ncbi:MAG: ATP-binding protein [Acidimicrobiia bacterium]